MKPQNPKSKSPESRSTPDPRPGVSRPLRARSGTVAVVAWRDTDEPKAPARYFLDVRMPGWPAHELLGLSPRRIKALGDALLQLHEQLPKPKKRAK